MKSILLVIIAGLTFGQIYGIESNSITPAVGLVDIYSGRKVSKETANAVTESIRSELLRVAKIKIINTKEILQLSSSESRTVGSDLRDCEGVDCIERLGKSAGISYIVYGIASRRLTNYTITVAVMSFWEGETGDIVVQVTREAREEKALPLMARFAVHEILPTLRIEGHITKVSEKRKVAMIDIGSNHGLGLGNTVNISRREPAPFIEFAELTSLSSSSVIEIKPDRSLLSVTSNIAVIEPDFIAQADAASSSLPAAWVTLTNEKRMYDDDLALRLYKGDGLRVGLVGGTYTVFDMFAKPITLNVNKQFQQAYGAFYGADAYYLVGMFSPFGMYAGFDTIMSFKQPGNTNVEGASTFLFNFYIAPLSALTFRIGNVFTTIGADFTIGSFVEQATISNKSHTLADLHFALGGMLAFEYRISSSFGIYIKGKWDILSGPTFGLGNMRFSLGIGF